MVISVWVEGVRAVETVVEGDRDKAREVVTCSVDTVLGEEGVAGRVVETVVVVVVVVGLVVLVALVVVVGIVVVGGVVVVLLDHVTYAKGVGVGGRDTPKRHNSSCIKNKFKKKIYNTTLNGHF